MELQGSKKATHDFLSLYKGSSSFQQHHDPRPPSQGFLLKTHDFLQPLERKRTGTTTARDEPPPPTAAAASPDINAPASAAGTTMEHVLPGGIGTYTIRHVPVEAVVKPEWPECDAAPRGGAGRAAEQPTTSRVVAAVPSSSMTSYTGGGAFSFWEESLSRDKGLQGGAQQQLQQHHHHQWPPVTSYTAPRSSTSSFGSLSSSRSQQGKDSRRLMEAASNFSKGFTDDDEDDEGFGRRDGSSHQELVMKGDGKSNNDQKPSTPRSKHSATEQRRRSKINDRFQILRDLIPHTDQKRDKASFLLEVIEYIQFLQEKVQKHESVYPGWNQDTTNVLPWVKVFFRSFWENSRQRSSLVPAEGIGDLSNVIKNGASPTGYVSSGDNVIPSAPLKVAENQASLESENVNSGLPNKATLVPVPLQQYGTTGSIVQQQQQQQQQRLISDSKNMAYPSQTQCTGPDTMTESRMNNEQELTIDEGTITVSSAYSQGLMHALTQCLQNSGIDLSQASINVQINLGKRAFNRPIAVPNERKGPSSGNHVTRESRSGSSGEESERAHKRHRLVKS